MTNRLRTSTHAHYGALQQVRTRAQRDEMPSQKLASGHPRARWVTGASRLSQTGRQLAVPRVRSVHGASRAQRRDPRQRQAGRLSRSRPFSSASYPARWAPASGDAAGLAVSSAWYRASRSCSGRFFGNMTKTSAAPARIAMIPAAKAHWSPARNDALAPAVIWLAYCGNCLAKSAALEKDFVSSFWTLLVICRLFGALAIAAEIAVAYPAASSAPRIDCMIAPPRSRCRSAVPDAIPARRTGTDAVSECEAGVPAKPTPIPISA